MNKKISWSSNDTSIATVDQNGKVTTIEAGNCVITATSQDSGAMAKCIVTVLQPITGISLNVNSKTIMKVGKKRKYTKAEREALIKQYTAEMKNAAKLLDFEHAAYLRDKIKELQESK